MKTIKSITIVFVLTAIFVSSVYAGEAPNKEQKINFNKVEANLLAGIDTDNQGLFISSAQKLGEFKSEKAVLPLMKVLKSSNDEASRIAAALSLAKIGNAKGMFAVKRAAKFDESTRVRNLCEKFYQASLR